MALSVFARTYMEALKELVQPDRPKINLLRDLAKENPHEARAIVLAISQHVLSCAPPLRLPGLYLIDCIMKTVNEPYTSLFSANIVSLFRHVWCQASEELKQKLTKLARTWNGLLPAPMLDDVTHLLSASAAPTAPADPRKSSESWKSQSQTLQPSVQPSAYTSNTTAMPQQLMHAVPAHVLNPGLSFGAEGCNAAQAVGVMYPVLPAPAVAGGSSITTIHAPTQVQQPAPPLLMPPALTVVPAPTVPPIPAMGVPPPSVTPPAAAQPALGELMSTLMNLGSKLGMGSTQPSTAVPLAQHLQVSSMSGPHAVDADSSGGAIMPKRSTAFASSVKEFDQSAVDELHNASNTTRAKFLDVQFLRKRRLKSAQNVHRFWYTPVDQWLQGTRSDADVVGDVFANEELPAAEQPLPRLRVEEDESHPQCAISGEPFDRVYDPATDKWYYEDAVILAAEEATKYGVEDGSVVKVHCLSGLPSALSRAQEAMYQPPQQATDVFAHSDLMSAVAEAAALAPADADLHSLEPVGKKRKLGEAPWEIGLAAEPTQQDS